MQVKKYRSGKCYAGEVTTPYSPEVGEQFRLYPYNETSGEYLSGAPERYFPITKQDRLKLSQVD